MDKAGYDKLVAELSKMSKLISVSTVVERFKVSGYVPAYSVQSLDESSENLPQPAS
jgi:hypothetical protein